MEYIQSIQKAIDYMEDNLLENINYEDVAKAVYMSNYYFHRIFSLVTGISANEYIKNRRLSLAGQELSMSKSKVIDIAMKYGYDSPESFSRAFTRFHGVSPSLAKNSGVQLKSFNRLNIKIIVEGGCILKYKIVERKSFNILAKIRKFNNLTIGEEDNQEIRDFWEENMSKGLFEKLKSITGKENMYGVCSPISRDSNEFNYGIGMEYEGDKEIEGFTSWKVNSGLWAVFKCIGKDGQCIANTWDKIFKEFLPSSEYVMLDDTDFEFYPGENDEGCFCEVWIPVKKK